MCAVCKGTPVIVMGGSHPVASESDLPRSGDADNVRLDELFTGARFVLAPPAILSGNFKRTCLVLIGRSIFGDDLGRRD